jgi:catechol 2,3-dioxygenase-like lactoylglutathione lyase family enzyme
MKRVTGLGGFFLKCRDPEAAMAWYGRHLGIPFDPSYGGWAFEWRTADEPAQKGSTLLTFFPAGTEYFGPGGAPFMCNFRVADMDALLAALAEEGVRIDPKREDTDYGRFAWIYDPDGQKIELWEPPAEG